MTNKEAINLISRNESVFQFDPAMLEALDLAIKALKEIPTVEYPFYAEAYQTGYEEAKKEFERPQGEWIFDNFDYRCSVCGEFGLGFNDTNDYDEYIYEPIRSDYCPYCGARMEGVKKND